MDLQKKSVNVQNGDFSTPSGRTVSETFSFAKLMVSTSPTGLFLISRCDSSTSEISKIPKVGKRGVLLGRETLRTDQLRTERRLPLIRFPDASGSDSIDGSV